MKNLGKDILNKRSEISSGNYVKNVENYETKQAQ